MKSRCIRVVSCEFCKQLFAGALWSGKIVATRNSWDSLKSRTFVLFLGEKYDQSSLYGAKREVRGSDYVCLCVRGNIFCLVVAKKYDHLNENRR